jgi:hypothetical protein
MFLSGINQPESPSDVATAYQKHGWGIIKAKDRTKEETKKEKKGRNALAFVVVKPQISLAGRAIA